MDQYATLSQPLAAVFRHVAQPPHLGDWLVDIVGVAAGTDAARWPDVGVEFALTLRQDGHAVAATGEVVAYEPPWLAAYRLCAGDRWYVVRIACTASGDTTHLHVHQGDGDGTLAVDLVRLERALAAAVSPGEGSDGRRA